ncbi:MAG: PTS sugar transporter subunit IIA [Deltaproteobacteria bacterium]
MRLADILRPDCVIADLSGGTIASVLAELARPAAVVAGVDAAVLSAALAAREKLGTTGVGDGVAVPHCKAAGLPALTAVLGRSREGVDFRAHDGKPTRIFVALLAPERAGAEHLQALARVSRILKRPEFRKALLEAADAAAMHQLVVDEDARP